MEIPNPFQLLGGKGISGGSSGSSGIGTTAPPMSGLLYGGNTLIKEIREVKKAITDFEPVRTQVIDLPTLNKANRIGGAMTITSI